MSINITKRPIKTNIKGHESNGYCAKVVKKGMKTIEDVIEHSLHSLKINQRDVNLLVYSIIDSVSNFLTDGYFVDLGDLGRFSPAANGHMQLNPDDIKEKDLKMSINYRPSDKLKKDIEKAEIKFINNNYDI